MLLELKEFLEKKPNQIIEWNDPKSSAKGWLVINSLKNGAAGGGTRMRNDCTLEEVIELAKTMEIKFAVSGPSIGGAKSGIRYDYKNTLDKHKILRRWFKYIINELENFYGTGGDQNVDLINDVDPILKDLGIRHPQSGIVRGYYSGLTRSQQNKLILNLSRGIKLQVKSDRFLLSNKYKIGDVATGFGIFSVLQAYYQIQSKNLKGKKIILEGFGNVGRPAAYFAQKNGAIIVGVIDKNWCLVNEDGIDVKLMFNKKIRNNLIKNTSSDKKLPQADIFIPAATSHTIDKERLVQLDNIGVDIIVCGANNPFINTNVEDLADRRFSVIPDYISNCGTARLFNYLMAPGSKITEKAIFNDINVCIQSNIAEIMNKNSGLRYLTRTAYKNILKKINL